MSEPSGSRLPEIAVASLYQENLVTRHTGRAVRLSIEGLVAEQRGGSLTVLDFGDVKVMDFSCADEVVAKLVLRSVPEARPERFFLFRGIASHHVDPVESALRRRGLAVAAQDPAGAPLLLGAVEPAVRPVWVAMCEAGRAQADELATRLGLDAKACRRLLENMHARRLVRRDGEDYCSLFCTLAEAEARGDRSAQEPPAVGSPRAEAR